MVKRRRVRVLSFGALALVAVLLPAGLAAGSHDGSSTFGDPSVILLTLGGTDEVRWPDGAQSITIRNNCSVTFSSSNDILDITPNSGSALGGVKDGLGVKSTGDGTGEPCGRVEASDSESISVALGSDLDGYVMQAIDVDLELKFNAVVDVIFLHEGVEVHRVVFDPMAGSDDGPDSGDGDNFRFAFQIDGDPDFLFDQVIFEPSAGALSLEGGADGTGIGRLAGNNSSQFEVIQSFDGQITCGDTVTIDDAEIEEVVGVITMQGLDLDASTSGGWDANCTQPKNYNENVTASSLIFAPVLENSLARYTMVLTLEDQPITTGSEGQITSLVMEYNDGFGSADRPLRPCLGQPEFTEAFFEAGNTGLLPAGEFACYYGVSLTPTGDGVGTEVWDCYFEDDPGFVW